MRLGAALRRSAIAAALLLLIAPSGRAAARACDLDHAPTTRWRTERDSRGNAWLRTPCGERFFSIGVNVVDAGKSGERLNRPHYDWRDGAPSIDAWAEGTRERLLGWGFNSIGAWSLAPERLRLPTAINLELGRLAKFHWFDPFDPAMPEVLLGTARQLTAPYRQSAWRMGYFSDNEVGWWGGALFVFYSAKPASNHTKQRWVAELERRYHGDFRRFAADFVPPEGVRSWAALLETEERTQLRPGSNGIAAVRHWTEVVAEHYYALTAAALHAADPGALFLGDRLPIYYDPVAVRAAARHVDVIAANDNVDSAEGWIAPYFLDGLARLAPKTPVLISEWFFAARENRTGNRNNGHLMTVDTQAERAAGAAAAARRFAGVPSVLGLHWFQYYDYPEGGRADREDYNFGLVDIHDRPYEALVAALGAANRALPAIHAEAHPLLRPTLRDFAAPRATIDFHRPSLADWPKPASLLPALAPSPGEVAFGEAYLTWSERGLALATVGQDFYDPDLLAFQGAFPLGEAYRVEIGVDAGAGAKRFTLYFIPPPAAERDKTMTKPLLCAGAPAEHAATACPGVPGGEALYFGANQPRLVGEALIPWQALGLDGPPASRRIRLELSATAWYHSRWMSLSGLAPGIGAARPERWAVLRLAD
jgi:hypothetical protein